MIFDNKPWTPILSWDGNSTLPTLHLSLKPSEVSSLLFVLTSASSSKEACTQLENLMTAWNSFRNT
jgi:hypothetical protein